MVLTNGLTERHRASSRSSTRPSCSASITGGAVIYWFTGASIQAVVDRRLPRGRVHQGEHQARRRRRRPRSRTARRSSRSARSTRRRACSTSSSTVFFSTLAFACLEPYFFIGYLISHRALRPLPGASSWPTPAAPGTTRRRSSRSSSRRRARRCTRRRVVGDTVGDPFKDTSSVAMNPVIKFTTLFGLLAVELAVELERAPSAALALAAVFFVISVVFVWRSFYGMRIKRTRRAPNGGSQGRVSGLLDYGLRTGTIAETARRLTAWRAVSFCERPRRTALAQASGGHYSGRACEPSARLAAFITRSSASSKTASATTRKDVYQVAPLEECTRTWLTDSDLLEARARFDQDAIVQDETTTCEISSAPWPSPLRKRSPPLASPSGDRRALPAHVLLRQRHRALRAPRPLRHVLATSVPVMPMAMPMSAAAIAGASLTPSPVIATMFFLALSTFDEADLVLGGDAGDHADVVHLPGRLLVAQARRTRLPSRRGPRCRAPWRWRRRSRHGRR